MGVFSFLSFFKNSSRKVGKSGHCRPRRQLLVEPLEDRFLPSCNVISGHVFHDANNNGLVENGETFLAGVEIRLLNSANQVVGTTTSDANGFYQFAQDNTISQAQQSLSQSLLYQTTQTDFSLSRQGNQFDPSLGQLVSVQIIHNGTLTSTIKVENTSPTSGANISATVSGSMILTGAGVFSDLNLSANAGSFAAGVYDQVLDFGGSSGFSFAPQAAAGFSQLTITGSGMNPFLGTGTVSLTETARATSFATGGGNLVASLVSDGRAEVSIVYNYIPSNCLTPGQYTIVLPSQPAGYLPGKEASNGVVLNVPPGTNAIPVTLSQSDSINNDFGELLPALISGFVYVDANNNGLKESGEQGIANVRLDLGGTNDLGQSLAPTLFSDAGGFYQFANLRPGTYAVAQTQPEGYLDGKVTPGSQGGTAGNNQISSIGMASGQNSQGNNFGELRPAGLSGYVYFDANNNGTRDSGDSPLGAVSITLSGSNDLGSVNQVVTTDAAGFYQFSNLRPGSYQLNEAQPSGYQEGTNNVGSLGGTAGLNQFAGIGLLMGGQGINYNFGEIQVADLSILKTAGQSLVQVGETFTYTLTVSNLGANDAQNLVVSDTLPSGVVYVSASSTGWTFTVAGGMITGKTGLLPVGVSSIITITVQAPLVVGNITNVATVTSDTPDINPGNNTSTVTTTVYNQPAQVIPRVISPLVTTAAVVSKLQLLPGGTQYMDQTLLGQLTYMDGLYRTLLGRPATAAEQMAGVQQLRAGVPSSQLVASIWTSGAQLANQVKAIYQSILQRNPNSAELNAGINMLRTGTSLKTLRYNLLVSQEYQGQHSTPSNYILGFYQNVLGQIPDSLTQLNLVQALGSSQASTMASALLNSEAAINQIVIDAYGAYLRRNPSSAEIRFWSSRLQAHQISEEAFLQALLTSNEFYNLSRNSLRA